MIGGFQRRIRLIRKDVPVLGLAVGVGLSLGSLSLIISSPLVVLAVVVLLLFLTEVAFRPEIGLLAILFFTSGLVDPERLPLLPLGPISLHLPDCILLLLLAKVLVRWITQTGLFALRTPLDFPLAWFYGAVLVSAATAILNPSINEDWVLRQVRPLTYYLSFFCVTCLVENKRQVSILIKGSFSIAVAASLALLIHALLPAYQLAGSRSVELVTAGQRFEGVERSYLQADRLIYMMLIVSVCSMAFHSRFLPSFMGFVRAGLLGAGLFFTFQRNYWLTAGFAVLLSGTLIPGLARARLIRWGIAAGVVLALLLVHPGVSLHPYLTAAWYRLSWGMRPETLARDDSIQWRVIETRHAIDSTLSEPVFGVGLRNFYRPAYPLDSQVGSNGLRWYIHNVYLWVLVDMGAFGFVPFAWFYIAGIWRGLARWRMVRDIGLRALSLGITLGVLGQAITNLVAPNFLQSWALAAFPILLGVREVILREDLSR